MEQERMVNNMKIIDSILTKNPCYTDGKKIAVKGLMLHSVGCSQPSAMVFIKQWNLPSFTRACVHGFIDGNTGDVYQTLPWNHRGWHGGGSSNNTHIGVEMCEPACIKYIGGSKFTCSNVAEAKAVAKRTYESAVELFAMLCKEYKLDPLADGVIVSHREGHARGIASNHGDPEHLWEQLGMGYTMNTFRNAVKAAMGGEPTKKEEPVKEEPVKEEKPVKEGSTYLVCQVGAYKTKTNANTALKKVKAAGFDACLTQVDGLYKIQVGQYDKKVEADAMLAKIKKAGFDAIIMTKSGQVVSSEPTPVKQEIKVGSIVKVNKGAKTYTGGNLAAFVYERNHKVKQINVDRVVITCNNVVVAAVKKSDLTLVE